MIADTSSNKQSTLRLMLRYWRAYVWISPFFILFAIFGLYPIGYSVVLAFFHWNGIGEWQFAGIQNFKELFTDRIFWQVLKNNLSLWLYVVPYRTLIALILAAILASPKVRGQSAFRIIYILPYITSMVLVSVVFRVLLGDHGGLVNLMLQTVRIPPVNWLRDARWTKISISMVMTWRTIGYFMVIMIAGLQRIPRHLYEAAMIDGANPVLSFTKITVPLMRPIVAFVVVISTIEIFQTFEVALVLTEGGPRNASTPLTYLLWKQAFQYSRLGYASSLAIIVFIIIAIVSFLQMRLFDKN